MQYRSTEKKTGESCLKLEIKSFSLLGAKLLCSIYTHISALQFFIQVRMKKAWEFCQRRKR